MSISVCFRRSVMNHETFREPLQTAALGREILPRSARYANALSPTSTAGSRRPCHTPPSDVPDGLLLNRDTGALDHIRPFGDLVFDKGLDVGKRHIHRHAGIRDDPVLHRWLGQ